MKCPRCAAENEPGAVACGYCSIALASADNLGDGARSLDARFDALAATVAQLLAQQTLPAVTAKTLHVAFAHMSNNVARMRDVLHASASAIPRPASAQEAMVWLRRAPALVWVSYRALGHTRNFVITHLADVLAELFRDREGWERRDGGLRAVFTQCEPVVRSVAPTLAQTAKRAARTNPLLAVVLAMLTVSALWSMVGGGSSHGTRARRSRRHAVAHAVYGAKG